MQIINKSAKFVICSSLILFLLLSVGCGGKKRIGTGESPDVLYAKAMKELNKEGGFPYILNSADYDKALNLLKEIQIRHTYSPYATLSELRTGDIYFKKEEYEQASIEYEDFLKRHPSHEDVSYAAYRLGLSHYKQKRSIDRDPTSLREAHMWFDYFISNYRHSEYFPEIVKLLTKTRNYLAKRELYIGDYYKKKNNYKASSVRYETVVIEYADTKYLERALYSLGEALHKMGENDLAKTPLQRVVTEYPTAHYHEKAEKLLSKLNSAGNKKAKK